MAYLGGDCRVVEFSHPTLGTIRMYPKAGEDYEINEGDLMIEDEDGMMAGDGRPIYTITRERASITTPPLARDLEGDDIYVYLKNLQRSLVDAQIIIQTVSGEVFGMSGRPVGQLIANPHTAQVNAVKLSGYSLRKLTT